ncbi:hypothetical protein QT196_20730 [Streptomyces sp. P9-2B-2]|uniref:hypothetical protein n=1 Tax=Streptomyces sp. P9-2B-2 TaxID=3057114 RepID=UPI0025B2B6EE|nr:hypothetical protein [Streptomyces sp. P9-2B-2]WJY39515.1 hypothetical protein QT196_20730 [Streptomyces sp. P9-2B-2]
MSADTAPEAGALADRADELKVKAAQAEEKVKAARAWAVQVMNTLGEGTSLLGKRLADRLKGWCLEAHRSDLKGLSADLGIYVRGALLLGAGAGLCWLVYRHNALMWPLAAGWSAAALRTKVSADKATAAKEAPADGGSEGGGKRAPGPSPETFLHLLHDLVQEHSEGSKDTPGLHWPQVVAGLSSRYPDGGSSGGWSAADCRALCEAAAVPISRGTRARGVGAGKGVSTGVRVEDLPDRPPLPSPSPSQEGTQAPAVAVVVAGQNEQQASNNNSNSGGNNTGEGAAQIVQDAENPARWHVLKKAG